MSIPQETSKLSLSFDCKNCDHLAEFCSTCNKRLAFCAYCWVKLNEIGPMVTGSKLNFCSKECKIYDMLRYSSEGLVLLIIPPHWSDND
jgi:hypothetical protein